MLNLDPATILSRILILIIAFTVHEFSHAFVANAYGDDTPRQNGRLSLNPAVHLDLMGSLMLLIAGFGWARPVPINPYVLRRRSPSALMWVSLAGPLSNLLLAIIGAIPLRMGLVPYSFVQGLFPSLYQFLLEFIIINLSLMLFNLIPVAPLDGEKIADYFFPASWQPTLDRIRPYGPMILLAIVFVLPMVGVDLLGMIMGPVLRNILRVLVGVQL
jgi:Zn-dependent protease